MEPFVNCHLKFLLVATPIEDEFAHLLPFQDFAQIAKIDAAVTLGFPFSGQMESDFLRKLS